MGEFHKHSKQQEVNETIQNENEVVIKKETPIQSDYNKQEDGRKKKRKAIRRLLFSLAFILVLITVSVLIYVKYLTASINRKPYENNVVMQEEKFDTDENDTSGKFEKLNPNEVKWNDSGDIKKVKGITNILLVADSEQESEEYPRGRSDTIIIVTINTKNKTLKLTSIMRDTYVQIPGCRDNRINTAYRTGDIPLLEKTIEENFNVSVDGYIKVDFNSFTEIVDELGGVEITLTEEEAEWLNKGNHIFDPASRVVEAGTHTLNGSQTLGYCIIRRIPTVDGLRYDFGRVWRQKLVLTTLFNKYKDERITKILAMAPRILSNITTDLPENKILSLVMTVLDLNVNEVQTLTVPIEGSYDGRMIRGMAVLVPNLDRNIQALDLFLYGEDRQEEEDGMDITDYEIDFSLTESNFKLKSIDEYTEKAFDVMKGYSNLTLKDVFEVGYQCSGNN